MDDPQMMDVNLAHHTNDAYFGISTSALIAGLDDNGIYDGSRCGCDLVQSVSFSAPAQRVSAQAVADSYGGRPLLARLGDHFHMAHDGDTGNYGIGRVAITDLEFIPVDGDIGSIDEIARMIGGVSIQTGTNTHRIVTEQSALGYLRAQAAGEQNPAEAYFVAMEELGVGYVEEAREAVQRGDAGYFSEMIDRIKGREEHEPTQINQWPVFTSLRGLNLSPAVAAQISLRGIRPNR